MVISMSDLGWQQGLVVLAVTIVALIVIAVVFALPTPAEKAREANTSVADEARAANEYLEKKRRQRELAEQASEPAATFQQHFPVDCFSPDEPFLEICMNPSCCLRRCRALSKCPSSAFFFPCCQESS